MEEAIILTRSLSVILRGQPDWVNRIIIALISKLTKHWMNKVQNPADIKPKHFRFIAAVSRLIENCSKSHEGTFNYTFKGPCHFLYPESINMNQNCKKQLKW